MKLIKNFFAFGIGLGLILLFYYFIRIPIIPCISLYAIALLFYNEAIKSRIFFVSIAAIIGIICYGANGILSIIHYPKYLTIIGIVLEFATAFSFITAWITLISSLSNDLRKIK